MYEDNEDWPYGVNVGWLPGFAEDTRRRAAVVLHAVVSETWLASLVILKARVRIWAG